MASGRKRLRRVGRLGVASLGILLSTACGASKASFNAAGSWTGSLSSTGATPVGIRFTLTDHNGQLTGLTYLQDPVTGEFLTDDEIQGSRNGMNASWQTTTTGLVVVGTFNGNIFVGTIQFPPDPEDGAVLVANLNLSL